MKNVVSLICAFFVATCVLSCGSATSSGDKVTKIDSSKLFVVDLTAKGIEQSVFDTIKLGRIKDGESVESLFIVKNVTDKPIAITNIVTGCGCTSVEFEKSALMSGQKSIVKIVYDSKGQFGTQMKAIEVVTSEFSTGKIYLSCTVVDN